MKIEQNISSAAAEAVKALYGVEPKGRHDSTSENQTRI